jgi:hypothetical protein
LDAGASDSPEPLHALLGYGWAEEQLAASLTRLELSSPARGLLRLRVLASSPAPLLGGGADGRHDDGALVSLDEHYRLDGTASLVPRRHLPDADDGGSGGGGDGDALRAIGRVARRDGGLQLTHAPASSSAAGGAGGLREWFGVATGPDGREGLVREMDVLLEAGRWQGVAVYRRSGPPPAAAGAAAASPLQRDVMGPIGDDLDQRPPPPKPHEQPPHNVREELSEAEEAALAAADETPTAMRVLADSLLESMPWMFGLRSQRQATERELALLASVEQGGADIAPMAEAVASGPPLERAELPGSQLTGERASLAQWLSTRRAL